MRRCAGKFFGVVCLLIMAGCSPNYYRKSADREAAKLIAEKTPAVPNMDPHFTLEQSTNSMLDNLPVALQTNDFFGAEANIEVGAKSLSLDQALELAVHHSRNYQNRKEQLFLQALDLSLARYRYTP